MYYMVPRAGLEPTTYGLGIRRSVQTELPGYVVDFRIAFTVKERKPKVKGREYTVPMQ